jgi:multidrug efflux pump subunit AcrA (membrane-fusion protein)
MKKSIILASLTGAVILAAVIWAVGFSRSNAGEQDRNRTAEQEVQNVPQIEFFTVRIANKVESVPVEGRIRAGNRLEIFPEVQGTVTGLEKPFREGTAFRKGEVLVQLDSEEVRLQLNASRSGFQALIASLLPDIKLDYPDALSVFETWFERLHPEEVLPSIPETENQQLNRFLASRGVYDRYYQIKSAEERLRKFTIRAPFSGVLSAANAEPGQAVGPQHHLGTFVDPDRFILTASVRQNQADRVQAGAELTVSDREGRRSWTAVIDRINPSVNPRTQMVDVYLDVSGDGLREGMYLKGTFSAGDETGLARIPKWALLRTGHVYIREEGVIRLIPVEIKDVERESVWVKGLADGDEIVQNTSRPVAGLIIQ